jgi:hypothetical protein
MGWERPRISFTGPREIDFVFFEVLFVCIAQER